MDESREETIIVNKEDEAAGEDTGYTELPSEETKVFSAEEGASAAAAETKDEELSAEETRYIRPQELPPGEEAVASSGEDAEAADKEASGDTAGETAEEAAHTVSDAKAAQYGLPAGHPGMGELDERIAKRRRESRKKRFRFRAGFVAAMILLMLIVFGFFFSVSGFFTVDSIEVQGNSRYTAEEIINMAHAVPGRNLLYSTNKKDMISYLEQNPYIKSASVQRKLPSTIVIIVQERTEKTAFRYDDDYLVMDGTGVLLRKSRNAPKVTIIEGIIVNRIKLGQKIGTEDKDKTDKALKLLKTMTASDLYFVKIDVTDLENVKAYIYDSLVVKCDYDTLMTNMDNGHLHKVVERLFTDGIKRGTIRFEDDGTASFMPIF